MQLPLQITFRDLPPSQAIEENIRKKAEKLERYHRKITGCHVVVEMPHKHHHQGRIFCVRIDVTIPGAELVASREAAEDHSHEDVYVAIRDAFEAVNRQLEERSRHWSRD